MRVGGMSPSVSSEVPISALLPDWDVLYPTYLRESRYKISIPATFVTILLIGKHQLSPRPRVHIKKMSSYIKKVAIVGVRSRTFYISLYSN